MGSRLDANSSQVRKRIERHTFDDEDGDEYDSSAFGKFGDYFRRKKIKLQNLDAQMRAEATAKHKPQIFRGVVAHVMGYTQPPLHTLHRLLVEHGAGFLQYLGGKTAATHVIASNMPPKKASDFAAYRIVKPAWVTDSIEAGRLLPWSDYRVIEEGPRQKTLRLGTGGVMAAAEPSSTPRVGYREQSDRSYWTSQLKSVAATPTTPTSPTIQYTQRITHVEAETPVWRDRFAPIEYTPRHDASINPTPGTSHERAFGTLPPGEPPEAMDFTFDMSIGSRRETTPRDERPAPEPPDEQQPSTPAPLYERNVGHQDAVMGYLDVPPLVGEHEEGSDDPAGQDQTENRTEQDRTEPERMFVPKPLKDMTPEEYNAWLLSDPKIRDASCANPNFLKTFYSESRLHHLSTWKAELKSKMQKLAAEQGIVKPAKLPPGSRHYIMHVDFDSFFCAVSLKKHPEYVDKPAVVAHGAGTGSEIASCNYTARKYGVKNGIWMKRALEMCPELKVLPYDFPGYDEASRLFYEAILEVGGVVQSVSVDEALLDVTSLAYEASGSEGGQVGESGLHAEQMRMEELALALRKRIKERTGCDVSVGIGGNILLARLALRKAKPAGQYQIKPEQVLDFLENIAVEGLPGVAGNTGSKLGDIGVRLVKDLRRVTKERLSSVLGPKTGERLWEYARGIDRQEVGEQPARKSVSAEVSWGIRFVNQQGAEEFVYNLCKELESRLLSEQVKGKQLAVKIMRRSPDAPLDTAKHLGHGQCDTFNKSVLFGVATCSADVIAKEAVSILRACKISPGDLRGLGVQLMRLEPIGNRPSSQKTLTFARSHSTRRPVEDPIEDESPRKKMRTVDRMPDGDVSKANSATTARRTKSHVGGPPLFVNRVDLSGGINSTPMNISGTQFILPPNPDPKVLAELPKDIRAKLMAQLPKSVRDSVPPPTTDQDHISLLSTQVDPEVFAALPEDMKAEVLATYGRRPPISDSAPELDPARRTSPARPNARAPTLIKRGRGRPRKALERQRDLNGNPIQYISRASPVPPQPPQAQSAPVNAVPDDDLEGLDAEFLAELPEDMRLEVIGEHRRQRHQARLKAARLKARAAAQAQARAEAEAERARLISARRRPYEIPTHVPKAPAKIVFPGSGMNTIDEVRDMLEGWYAGTRDDGPHDSDVAVLERYLGRVVLEERDMNKATVLVRALQCVVMMDSRVDNDGSGADEEEEDEMRRRRRRRRRKGKEAWGRAVERIKEAVRSAVGERGLGTLKI